MLLVRMPSHDSCSLNDEIEPILKPMDIGGQPKEPLKIFLSEYAKCSGFSAERSDTMIRNLLKRTLTAAPELLEGIPDRTRHKGQG
jgi:hypothetical protein